jgi:hypothetical protein
VSRTYADFKETHPEYDFTYLKRLRAWYTGGKQLLQDKDLMKEVFPRHARETDDIYAERMARAQYIAYPGQILDSLVAELRSSPISLEGEREPWYDDFYKDVSAPEGHSQSLNDLVAEAVREALITQTAWALVDLPSVELPEEASAAQQEEAGALDAYAMLVPAEKIINWETNAAGELEFVMMCDESRKWGGLGTRRGDIVKVYTFYTRDEWEKWSIVWKDGQEPEDDAAMTFEGGGTHTFGRVPFSRLELPDGLWAMNKLESIARSWFNKRNALDWSTYKNLFPVMYAKLERSPIDPDGEESKQKLLNQKGGPGHLLVIGENEELAYAQPNPGIYATCLQDLRDSRDEMHRVTFTMAQSVDNSGAALQRAASSKAQDRMATAIVLGELGSEGRRFVESLFQLVAAGRQDDNLQVRPVGLDGYSDAMVDDLVEQTIKLEPIDIPSATFHQKNKLRVAKAILGRDATEEEITKIRLELEQNITPESLLKKQETTDVKAQVSPSKQN